ncbi:hypothetical protein LOZ07_001504 [Ophidiomyces ophidiicola]|nr:hypothetical protein LOZ60_004474 [Ophidiomyces ophidiicola]KAI1966165.1 hypothetical protein LOZ59_000982 [Ophidiomyces ophidiicola]KAI1976284.1 hypothetical protein LOZ56_000019 [Ophidiomyces ophidiicola]KAI2097673.1 hypothetical protein LOZ33_003214 [Ophidiomyces ophidiicola]KAI2213982.1 hypothetical protein LOZ16_000962 [Ophidiomyces ophidiicola]
MVGLQLRGDKLVVELFPVRELSLKLVGHGFSNPSSVVAWNGNYSDITDADLECLLEQCRHSVACLESEFSTRNIRTYSVSTRKVDGYFELLRQFALQIDLLGRLDHKTEENVHIAVGILGMVKTDRKTRVYQEFIFDILRLHGPELFLLCVGRLGKHRLANLNDTDRLGLLSQLREKGQAVKVVGLTSLIIEHNVPSFDSPQLAHLAHLYRKRTWDEGPGNRESGLTKDAPDLPQGSPQPVQLSGYTTSAFLPLDETGAEVILKAAKEDAGALKITLPAPHESLPFMLIPHQICANIMRKYTDQRNTP